MVHILDLMEPEETVGNIWHAVASRIDAPEHFPDEAVSFAEMRTSLVVLFRALGGGVSVEIGEAPAMRSGHRLGLLRRIGTEAEMLHLPRFDGMRLGLPPVIDMFPTRALNRACFRWLTALSALVRLPAAAENALATDLAAIIANSKAAARVATFCPGLTADYRELAIWALSRRPRLGSLTGQEALIEQGIQDVLSGKTPFNMAAAIQVQPRGYRTYAPVALWPIFSTPTPSEAMCAPEESSCGPPPDAARTKRKIGLRRDQKETNRGDPFIMYRLEAILSWVESMNLNRMTDDDDDENAQKAADDQDNITLSKHDRKTATRLRLHLDLSPADADHERLAEGALYPEWNHSAHAYLPDHCRVLEAEAKPDPAHGFLPDPNRLARVRRQFEALRPRRILHKAQMDGPDLDIDALISTYVEIAASGRGSDRIYQDLRTTERDLSVAFLLDVSRSTEAALGGTCVIDVAREALSTLAGGIDAAGDRLGIWAFSSLRRDRVFISRCKAFDEGMSQQVMDRICGLKPGHYTRLGAAIRHISAQLADEAATRKLLIVITDGKPNDLDHYEGSYGIEDSHMAVREARRQGQTVYGVVIDEDGQDWFARIFGRGGFTLMPSPARLLRALPDIYRMLIKES
ncbi:nitric oxide reductase activation protein NorD [Roseinatronobacter sp. S2]|uniref:nitric oxide reductase activation protein NorD n=1 Tax=Roseinatronobacter sp. S2 TaxID=3035471 RepID=UPI00240FA739|nr:VWA domain-containing protein [Roseinatronobacter sp. S2]WFE77260.1 VWA domain-containing protein [Roseinatronobacter sp. S2]